MRFIKKWRVVLIIGIAAIAIPIAARVSPTQTEFVMDRTVPLHQQTADYSEVAKTAHTNNSKAGVGHRVTPPQDYYDRRREYWEDRMEGRADYLEQEDGNDEDSADSEDGKDSSDDDAGDSMDDEEEMIEKRREYWRDRLDRDW
jgi:ribosomal protein S3